MSEYSSIYPGNSYIAKEQKKQEEKKIEKVTSGSVKKKKKSGAEKFSDIFIAEDANSVWSYVCMDVIVPALKKAVVDVVKTGIDMIVYGESGRTRGNSSTSRYSYSKYYDDDKKRTATARSSYHYDDVILESRGEAEDVLSSMDDIIDQYGIVSVADLYDLVGVSSEFTDNKYGWTNIRNASVIRVRDGYKIKLPKAQPL